MKEKGVNNEAFLGRHISGQTKTWPRKYIHNRFVNQIDFSWMTCKTSHCMNEHLPWSRASSETPVEFWLTRGGLLCCVFSGPVWVVTQLGGWEWAGQKNLSADKKQANRKICEMNRQEVGENRPMCAESKQASYKTEQMTAWIGRKLRTVNKMERSGKIRY